MPGRARVTFLPADRSAEVKVGATVLEAAAEAGVLVPAPCGGRGACGRCAVRVIAGDLAPSSEDEVAALSRARMTPASGVRLACMARISGPVTLRTRGESGPHVRGALRARVESVVAGVDLGTTSVAVQLVDARGGSLLATVRVPNRQARWGTDVLSRVSAALAGDAEGLAHDAETSVAEGLEAACAAAGVDHAAVDRIVVAGNTAMISLLARVDVTGLAAHPFADSLAGVERLQADVALGGRFGSSDVLLVPAVGAFVGGDLVAGMLAEGLTGECDGSVFVDLGTNAEVAVVAGERVVATSAPAGPAFEGWGIACGGQAGPGGITAVEASQAAALTPVFDGERPSHLTGSGLVSAVALLRRLGHLDPDGLILTSGPASARFFDSDGVVSVSLAPDPVDRSVFLTQLDVRAFQSAKAAVCAAVRAAVSYADLRPDQVSDLVVAGAFGGALATADLVELGVVPAECAHVVRTAPDAAVRGAAAIALDPGLIGEARALAARAVHIDLAAGASFTRDFMECLRLGPYAL